MKEFLSPRPAYQKGGNLCLTKVSFFNSASGPIEPDWDIVKCCHCGVECFLRPVVKELYLSDDSLVLCCSTCALLPKKEVREE